MNDEVIVKNYGWRLMTLYRRQGSDHPQEKEMEKAKWLCEEALQIVVKKKRRERQRRKGTIYPFKCRVPKNSKERKEGLPQ